MNLLLERLRFLSGRQRLLAAGMAATAAVGAVAAPIAFPARVWYATPFLGAVLTLAANRLARPWFEGLPATWRWRLTSLPVVVIGVLFITVAMVAVTCTGTADQTLAAGSLFVVWMFNFAGGGLAEPTDFPLHRLRGRLVRAACARVFALWCGLAGLLLLTSSSHAAHTYRPSLFTATMTLLVAGTAASLKIFARVRKLSTELHRRAQDLIRSLEELRDAAEPAGRCGMQAGARRSWDALHIVLRNRIETGFHLQGTFVLPASAIRGLEATVMAAIDAPAFDAARHRVALSRLRVIRAACGGHIDTLV
ncbi:hypothetical protein ACIHFE_26075 [Streptomyces sp. NPDC052396]|uniref:hypothetical protein n=1 Tax=Streptomyces sp. NPDC052396 TaxID=3365689 RepID=UPI0037D8D4E2